jgi:hypothetical protein
LCSVDRISVDDSEPVCDAHWEAWDLAWEAAGKLEGAWRRGLCTLDEALALARADALVSSVGPATQAATEVATVLSELPLDSLVEGSAGTPGEVGAEAVAEAQEKQPAAAHQMGDGTGGGDLALRCISGSNPLLMGDGTGGGDLALRCISGSDMLDASDASVEAVVAVTSPAVFSGAAPTCGSEASPDGRRAAVDGEDISSALVRMVGKGDLLVPLESPYSSEANHTLPMVMMPELSDEAPPIVLCVRQVGAGYRDDTRIEPPAGFDCNINDLLKVCVLL